MHMTFTNGLKKGGKYTLLHLMCVIPRAPASTRTNSLIACKK